MDKSSTIIGIVIVVIIVLPFLIYNIYKSMKKRKFQKDFMDFAEKANLKISRHDIWKNHYAIGIDSDSKRLLYYNIKENKPGATLIELSEVQKCRVVSTDRHVKSQNSINDKTNRLELVITYNNSGVPEKILEFYKNPEFMPGTEDFAHADTWLSIINSNLENRQS
jgi:hypothetical protein